MMRRRLSSCAAGARGRAAAVDRAPGASRVAGDLARRRAPGPSPLRAVAAFAAHPSASLGADGPRVRRLTAPTTGGCRARKVPKVPCQPAIDLVRSVTVALVVRLGVDRSRGGAGRSSCPLRWPRTPVAERMPATTEQTSGIRTHPLTERPRAPPPLPICVSPRCFGRVIIVRKFFASAFGLSLTAALVLGVAFAWTTSGQRGFSNEMGTISIAVPDPRWPTTTTSSMTAPAGSPSATAPSRTRPRRTRASAST